jgi:hypothetical protein
MVGTLRGRLWARDAVSSKGKRAGARNTMQSAHQSTVETIRNIGGPYHGKAQRRRLRYSLKYLYLVANSKRQTAPNGEGRLLLRNPEAIGSPAGATSRHQLARESRHQLARESRHQLARPISTARLLSMRC